jgi:hypothetical protein
MIWTNETGIRINIDEVRMNFLLFASKGFDRVYQCREKRLVPDRNK